VKSIVIKGARENNLKDVSLEIPRDRLVVITGLSGSGKSSLAFDTIYAEGQRRYVESLSPYVRQFLEQMGRPDVDSIDGLSPAISIEQRGLSKNPRSTVGTVTEIYDYLRLLYARVGRPHCPRCERSITSQSVQQMVDQLLRLPQGARFSVMAGVVRDRKGEFRKELESLRRDGFARVNINGEVLDLSEEIALDKNRRHTIEVYVDRLVLKTGIESRLTDSLELGLKLGGGQVKVALLEGPDLLFSEKLACVECGLSFPDLSPRSFSFNNPRGACPGCSGLGVLMEFDEDRIVPHPELSLREGAIEPWEHRSSAYYQQVLDTLAAQFGFDLFVPYAELPASVKALLMRGSGDVDVEFSLDRGGDRHTYRRPFEGVIANLERRLGEQQRRRKEGGGTGELEAFDDIVEEFHRYMRERTCPECDGARLRAEARHVLLGGRPIHAVTRLGIAEALDFFGGLALEDREREIAGRVLQEISGRLSFLCSVGLEYLSLDRTSASLSGGEAQRVRLATQIGSSLMGVLYILDEPSIGLHQRDHARLLQTLLRLRDAGNTVLVVEHDEATIRAADFVVDLGPGAGTHGGEVVAAGTPDEIVACPRSLTGQYLSGTRRIEVPRNRRRASRHLTVRGARQNNLKDIDVRFPLGVLTCVTGVSGSGKSTLVVDTLLPALRAELHGAKATPGTHRTVEGVRLLDKIIAIDQSPIGRTPRSNPATYAGVFAPVRELFASLPESKVRGYRAGRYSFNVKGGRCEACQGDGILRIAMHFLPDVFVQCEVCGGRRYNRETLQVAYKGSSIADVLAMTVDEASDLLGTVPTIRQKLEALRAVGLGYLALGQPANTLSGGEAQRLKLSKELARRATGSTLYILDEPTTGLHVADIQVLLGVLEELVEAGNTVVVIEHHLDVIKCADHVIDLGPEGGEHGGRVVATGTPEEVARVAESYTGQWLGGVLGRGSG
jgi:excinuclease ABC subunit A